MSDGSIVFDTKINTSDSKAQLNALKTELKNLTAQMKTVDSNRNKLYSSWEKSGFKDNGLRDKLSEADGEAKRLREDIERVNEAISMTKAAPSRKTTAGDAVDGISDASSKIGKQISGSAPKGSFFQKLKNGFSTAGNTIKGFLGSLMGGNKGLDTFNGRLKTGIGTVFKYALGIRSLYVLFNKLRQFLSAGIGNLQQYSQQTANSINALQTSATFAGNALAAAFEPILSAVVPILTTLIDALATACNWIARFFAMLGGQKTYTKAVKGANQYAKATSGVGSASKKAADAEKGQLAAIDEINDISKQQDSGAGGGSGGGGGGGMDYGSMFETAQVAGDSLIDQMKAAIDAGDWEGAGKLLADKVNSLFEGIQWESLGTQFGTNLAHVIEFGYGFISNLDTAAWGADLAAFVNGTITAMNVEEAWRDLGGMLVRIFTNAIDFVGGFLLNLDYGQIAIALSQGFEGAMDELTTWLNGIDWAQVGAQTWQNLVDFFGNLDYAGLATRFFTLLGTAFRSLALLLGGFFGNIGADIKTWWDTSIQGENWIETASNLLKAIGQGFADIAQWVQENIIDPFMNALLGEDKWSDIKQAATDIWNGFTEGLKVFFDNPGKWIKEHMIDPFVNWVKNLLGIHSPSTVFIEIGRYVILGLLEGLTQIWDEITNFFEKGFEGVKKIISEKWEAVKENTKAVWDKITGVLGDAKKAIQEKWQDVKDWFSQRVTDPVKEKFRDMGQNISSKMQSAKQGVQSSWNTVAGFFGNVRSGINQKFQDVSGWFREKFNAAKDALKSGFSQSSIYSHMLSVRNSISGVFSNIWSTASRWGRDMMDGLKSGINSAKYYVTSAVSNVASGIKRLLHFSRPDEGPLRDYEEWMPDMMEGLASGIESSMPVVDRAMAKLANHMGGSLQVEPSIPDLALGKVIPAAMSLSGSAASNQQETMQQLVDAVNELRDRQNDINDVIRALETLTSVVRSKKLLTSDVGKAAADYANSEYERTGETIFEGV